MPSIAGQSSKNQLCVKPVIHQCHPIFMGARFIISIWFQLRFFWTGFGPQNLCFCPLKLALIYREIYNPQSETVFQLFYMVHGFDIERLICQTTPPLFAEKNQLLGR